MDQIQTHQPQSSPQQTPEKYLIAFVIQGDDVFKITADNIIHTTGTAAGPAFDAIAKLKAAAALLELTNRHKERPNELRKMARELAGEGMKLMAAASGSVRSITAPAEEAEAPEVVKADAASAEDKRGSRDEDALPGLRVTSGEASQAGISRTVVPVAIGNMRPTAMPAIERPRSESAHGDPLAAGTVPGAGGRIAIIST